jgi:predicted amidohydrolase YtcJ
MSPPSYVVHNATVYTVDPQLPTASAFAVRNGRFVQVGTDAEVQAAFSNVPSVDAGGRTVVPGFIDAHAHLHELGHALRRVDLTDTSSPEGVVERLRAVEAKQDRPSTTWLRGHGWDQTDWSPPHFPSRTLLDAAFPERPVWLTHTDVHVGWANTAALEATVGLDRLRRMNDPEGGRIHRDAEGNPTGILIDRAMALVTEEIPLPSPTQQNRALRTALGHTARHGITGLHDAGVTLSHLRRFQRFIEEDAFPLRVYAMIQGRSDSFDILCERGPYRDASGRLDVASTKFFADGALGSRGAALLSDYTDDPGNRGLLRHSPEDFKRQVQAAVECGFQVNTHAIGDRANRMVLDAYEAARSECDAPVRRPRIEHAQVVTPEDRPRFDALEAIASVQPAHATSDLEWVADRLGPERLDGAYAWKSLCEAGATLAFGSDAPIEPIDPLRSFHAAVTRQTQKGHPENGWRPSERLPRMTALRAATLNAAYAAFWENEVGSITPGKRADWVVLSHDLMSIPEDMLPETDVVATYLDGCCVYSASDWPDP